jgi:hypothetical protein
MQDERGQPLSADIQELVTVWERLWERSRRQAVDSATALHISGGLDLAAPHQAAINLG